MTARLVKVTVGGVTHVALLPVGGGTPSTNALLAEAGDSLTTESGDILVAA